MLSCGNFFIIVNPQNKKSAKTYILIKRTIEVMQRVLQWFFSTSNGVKFFKFPFCICRKSLFLLNLGVLQIEEIAVLRNAHVQLFVCRFAISVLVIANLPL